VARNAELLRRGADHVRTTLGTPSPRGGIPTAPCLEVVALPPGCADTPEEAEALWQRLYAAGFVVPPVPFAGRGLLRLAAAAYNDEDDYERIAEVLVDLVGSGALSTG
jgi:isopenicillin-N epimerase